MVCGVTVREQNNEEPRMHVTLLVESAKYDSHRESEVVDGKTGCECVPEYLPKCVHCRGVCVCANQEHSGSVFRPKNKEQTYQAPNGAPKKIQFPVH